MHGSGDFAHTLALVCSVAAITTVLCQRIRLPVVFGYLLAGMIVGPHVPLPLVADPATVDALAQSGVVFLMFGVGLEFSLRRMIRLAPVSGGVALLETSMLFVLGGLAAQALGWPRPEQVLAGAIVAISSTTIIARAFADAPPPSGVRDAVFGVLVFEDLIAVVALAVIESSRSGVVSAASLGGVLFRLGAFLVALLGVGLFIVPRLVRHVVSLRRDETTLVTAIGLAFGAALLAASLGYSTALGAFCAGALVAESGARHAVERLIAPLRDFFTAVFFVAVGMSIDPALIARHGVAIAVFTVVVVVGKLLAVSVSTFLAGRDVRTAVQSAMSLAQIGEFSFIIAGTAAVASPHLMPVAVAVSAITTLATPALIGVGPTVAARVDRSLPPRLQTLVTLYGSWLEALRKRRTAGDRWPRDRRLWGMLALDGGVLALLIVASAVEIPRGITLLGDAFHVSPPLAGAALMATSALVAAPLVVGLYRTAGALASSLALHAIPLPTRGADFGAAPRRALTMSLRAALLLAVGLPVTAIARSVLPAVPLVIAGVLVMILLALGVWRGAANLHGHSEAGAQLLVSALRHQLADGDAPHAAEPIQHADTLLPGMGKPVAVPIEASHAAAGRTLRELNLRARTGAAVLAVHRGTEQRLLPRGSDRIESGDVLAVAGTASAVRQAIALLTAPSSQNGPSEPA